MTIAPALRPKAAWLAPAACVGGATVAALWLYGYAFGFHNHAMQIPLLLRLQQPELYPGDPFIDAMDHYFSVFWPAMAWLTRGLPLEPVFFAGHALTLVLKYAAIFKLARWVFPHLKGAPYLAVWLHLWGKSYVGGETLHWFYWNHTAVATALGFWACGLAARGRWRSALALAGVIFNLQAMQAAYLLLMIGAAWVLDRRRAWREALIGGALFTVLAIPTLIWMHNAGSVKSPPDVAELMQNYFPSHFFAGSFEWDEWLGLAATIAMLAIAWKGLPHTPAVRRITGMCAAILGLWVVGILFGDVWPVGIVIKLHVFRASSFFAALTLILFSGWLMMFGARRVRRNWRPAALAATLVAIAFFHSLEFFDPHSRRYTWSLAAVAGAGVAAAAMRGRGRRWALVCGMAGLLLLTGLLQIGRREAIANFREKNHAWYDVQRWSREHSEIGDRFLTPPDIAGFRVFSQRAVVGEWFDGGAVMWDNDYTRYWKAWFRKVGGTNERPVGLWMVPWLARVWLERPQAEIEAIAKEADARFIVMRKADAYEIERGLGRDWQGELLFENERYFVVRAPE